MFAAMSNPMAAYRSVGVETGVVAASPHQLVLMLFEGALLALVDAKAQMSRRETAAKGASLSKAIMIIEQGLKASLDTAAGELSENLAALYQYMCDRLLVANLHNKPEIIDEVSRLLGDLRGAWEQIKPAPSARAPHARPASVGVTYGKV